MSTESILQRSPSILGLFRRKNSKIEVLDLTQDEEEEDSKDKDLIDKDKKEKKENNKEEKKLCILLLFQSISSIILQYYTDLLKHYTEVTLFLTMIVGAGGNASNQSAVEVIRGLATGEIKVHPLSKSYNILKQEFIIAILLSCSVFVIGFIRVSLAVSDHDQGFAITLAISLSLFSIVMLSIILGSSIPILLEYYGFDAAHAGPLCQVLADILGVLIVCVICNALLIHPSTILTN